MKKYKKPILIFTGIIFALVIAFISNVVYDNNKSKKNIAKLEQDIIASVKYDKEIDESMMTYTWGYMNQNKGGKGKMAIAKNTIDGNILRIYIIIMTIDGYIEVKMYMDNIDNAVKNNTDFDNWESYREYLSEKIFLDNSNDASECTEKFLNKIKG